MEPYSNHGKRLISDQFSTRDDIKIIYVKEFLSHDGCDKYGPKSDIWDLYICFKNISTGNYNYCHYVAENRFHKDNKIEYELDTDNISSKYLVTHYYPGQYFGDTHTYMYSVFRVVNKLCGNPESEWNKVSKSDLQSVKIYLDDIELDPFTTLELTNQ